jgi:hypothetical protein
MAKAEDDRLLVCGLARAIHRCRLLDHHVQPRLRRAAPIQSAGGLHSADIGS